MNHAPINTVPTSQTVNEDTPLVFSIANGDSLSITDVDAGSNPLQVTLSVSHGTLALNGTAADVQCWRWDR